METPPTRVSPRKRKAGYSNINLTDFCDYVLSHEAKNKNAPTESNSDEDSKQDAPTETNSCEKSKQDAPTESNSEENLKQDALTESNSCEKSKQEPQKKIELVPSKPKKQKMTQKQVEALPALTLDDLETLDASKLVHCFTVEQPSKNVYMAKRECKCALYEDSDRCTKVFEIYRSSIPKEVTDHFKEHFASEREQNPGFQCASVQYRQKSKIAGQKKAAGQNRKKTIAFPKTSKQNGQDTKPATESQQGNSDAMQSVAEVSFKPPQKTAGESAKPDHPKPTKRPAPKRNLKQIKALREKMSRGQRTTLNTVKPSKAKQPVWCAPNDDHIYHVANQRIAGPGDVEEQEKSDTTSNIHIDTSPSPEEQSTPNPSPISFDGAGTIFSGAPMATKEEIVEDTNAQDVHGHPVKIMMKAIKFRRRRKEEPIPQEKIDFAMACMKELSENKRNEHFELVCKMCTKRKVFTAAASLNNHYKSHAGIKGFRCDICFQLFTRKHSLNYHVRIHEDIFIIQCSYCARWFRHKSHHKEHLRKHTGETPYECVDCDCFFKTRNTFKRHLRTRHGKILTREGTIDMTPEDFAKVKTKKYKKSSPQVTTSPSSSSAGSTPTRNEAPPTPTTLKQEMPAESEHLKQTSSTAKGCSSHLPSSSQLPSSSDQPLPSMSTLLSTLSGGPQQLSLGVPASPIAHGLLQPPVTQQGTPMICMVPYGTNAITFNVPVAQNHAGISQPSTSSQGQAVLAFSSLNLLQMFPSQPTPPTQQVAEAEASGDYKAVGFVTTHNQ